MKITISSKSQPVTVDRFIRQIKYLCKIQNVILLYPGTTFETSNRYFLTECADDDSLIVSSTDNYRGEAI